MASQDALQSLLGRTACFACLDENSRHLIAGAMAPLVCEDGQVICREGDQGDCLYVVESGRISVQKAGEDGSPVSIATLGPAEVVGEMSLFDQSPRSASVQAMGLAKLWSLANADFGRLLDQNPGMGRALLASLSGRLRRETATVASLKTSELDRRTRIAVFDSKSYTERAFREVNADRFALKFLQPRLSADTVLLAAGFAAVCAFVNDRVDAEVAEGLHRLGVGLVALRCAGYNNVDLAACREHGLSVTRVPAYSPYAVAEHAVALMLTLNRKVHRAHARVREGNFSLEGLVGFDMHGKTVGVIGTGKIGKCVISILQGFGCEVLVFSRSVAADVAALPGVRYVRLDELLARADIVTLHAPLTAETRYLINAEAIAQMRPGVMLVNTSRGGLVDTAALIDGLKSGHVGSAGLDVYEEESGYFFEDF